MNNAIVRTILGPGNDQAIVVMDKRTFDRKLFQKLIDEYGYKLFEINGQEIKSKGNLFTYISQVLEFPDYFGYNWDALSECVRDLEWLQKAKGYILLFSHPENFLRNSPLDFKIFLRVVSFASTEWRTDQIKFQLFLLFDEDIHKLSDLEIE